MDEATLHLAERPAAKATEGSVTTWPMEPRSTMLGDLDESIRGEHHGTVHNRGDHGRPARKVLVIASRFPPVASVGAIRVRKFVKYLPQFNWKPVVITGAARSARISRHDARRAADPLSLNEIPADIPVHRLSPIPDNWPGFASRSLSGFLAGITGRIGADETWWRGVLKWRIEKLHDKLTFPDRGIWRLPSAVRLARRLHREHRFDAVFSTGMPFSDHLIGLVVSSMIRKPWIADFRDPWVEYIHWRQWEDGLGRLLTKWSESAVISRAAAVISVNDHMTRRFKDRYAAHVRKFNTIENGYDPDDFADTTNQPPGKRFRLLHAGSLYETRSPMNLLAAWRRFITETPGAAEHAQLEFAGRAGVFRDELTNPADRGTIVYHGVLPHAEALAAMSSADVNLIMLPDLPGSEGDTTAKMYECIGAGRAILATVPRTGAAAAELGRHDGVWLVSPKDIDGIHRAICDLYRRWLSGTLQVRRTKDLLNSVTRRRQTEQLAELFNRVAPCRGIRREVVS